MENIIDVTPDKNGKIYVKLYGTRYEIRINKTTTKKQNKTEEKSDE